MKFNIIIPFKPYQVNKSTNEITLVHKAIPNEQDCLLRGITALRKNSFYYHRIIIAIEPDIILTNDYKSKFKDLNVEFFTAPKVVEDNQNIRICGTNMYVIETLPDEEYTCFNYISDLVCGKYWDLRIKEMIDRYGDNKVYGPMFIEPRNRFSGTHQWTCGPKYAEECLIEETSWNSIWNIWRGMTCHALSMKIPKDRDYMIEKDLDDWSEKCNQFDKDSIVEKCGDRNYGYWSGLVAKNRIFKMAKDFLVQPSAELAFDGELGRLGYDKVVVTRSHLFHLHNKIELDNVSVNEVK